MQELLELRTGQVSFISGLLAGFALTIAVHVLRRGLKDPISQIVFSLFVLTTFLFLIALYTDVRLAIEMAGVDQINDKASSLLQQIRAIGTNAATAGFLAFIVSIGLMGWVATPLLGIFTSLAALFTLSVLLYIWVAIGNLQPYL